MPMVKRSMSSRAKFSLGSDALSVAASSQISMAGSTATAWVSCVKFPDPMVRNSWFCRYMKAAKCTFEIAVGK